MRFLKAAWDWTMVADWRTWIAHAVLGSILAGVIGPWAAMMVYLGREIEQVFDDYYFHPAGPTPSEWLDHVMDFVSPFLAITAEIAVFHWNIVRW